MQLYNTALEAGLCALFLIPIFLILNKIRFRNTKSTLLYFLFAVYLAGVYAVVGLPNIAYIRFDANINLIPFRNMTSDISGSLLNIILFIPLSFFAYLLWTPFRQIKNALLFGLIASFSIELAQLFTYRATDINDLITNSAGALLGYYCAMLLAKVKPSLTDRNPLSDLTIVAGLPLGIMFFFQPVIWKLIY